MSSLAMSGKFVVGWDLPFGMPDGVFRLVNLQHPQWTCLFCAPASFASVHDNWPALRSRVLDDLRHVDGWCFFAFESLQENCDASGNSEIHRRLLQASFYLDNAMGSTAPAARQTPTGHAIAPNPSAPIWLSRMNSKGLPPALFVQSQQATHQEWIEAGLTVAFETGWQEHWRQLGQGSFRGFMHLHTGFWMGCTRSGARELWDDLTLMPPTPEQRERLLSQVECLWTLSSASSSPVAPALEPRYIVALHERSPERATRLLTHLNSTQTTTDRQDRVALFISQQYAQLNAPPLSLMS